MIVVLVGIGVMLSALVVQGIATALGLEAIGALLARHSARRSAIASCAPTPPFRGLTTIRTP